MGPALILIGGPAGAGKTLVAHAIARALPTSVVLDKDTLAGPFVEALLARLGQRATDRESPQYLEHVRPLEYRVLLDTAFEVMQTGRIALAVAPFARELNDPAWLDAIRFRARHCNDGGLGVVWIQADAETTRTRIVARGEARDERKLAQWDEYAARTRFHAPDARPAHVFDNRSAIAEYPTRRDITQAGADEHFARQLALVLDFIQRCAASR